MLSTTRLTGGGDKVPVEAEVYYWFVDVWNAMKSYESPSVSVEAGEGLGMVMATRNDAGVIKFSLRVREWRDRPH